MALYVLAEDPAWGKPKLDLVSAIGMGVFSLGNMITAIIQSKTARIFTDSASYTCERDSGVEPGDVRSQNDLYSP